MVIVAALTPPHCPYKRVGTVNVALEPKALLSAFRFFGAQAR